MDCPTIATLNLHGLPFIRVLKPKDVISVYVDERTGFYETVVQQSGKCSIYLDINVPMSNKCHINFSLE